MSGFPRSRKIMENNGKWKKNPRLEKSWKMKIWLKAWKSYEIQIFNPSAIKAVPLRLWGYSDHQKRAGGRAVRNSAPTKKLTDEFCLFFYRHDLCAWAIHPIYFFWHQAISGHFLRWPPKKLVGTITYEPLVGLRSNLVWLFSRYLWWSD